MPAHHQATLFPYTTLFRSARVVAQALDLAGVAARHHPQALVDDSEPDRRAHLGAIAPKRREAYVALARELGEGHWRLARDLGFQLADARGDDVDKPVDLGGGDTEGRREAHDLAARVDDRAALPRLAVELGDFRGRERLARAVRRHQLRAHEQPAAAHLADDALARHRLSQPVQQALSH